MKITSKYYNTEMVVDFGTLTDIYKGLIEPNKTLQVAELSNYVPFLSYDEKNLRIGSFILSTEKEDNERIVNAHLQKDILYVFLENLKTLVAMERAF